MFDKVVNGDTLVNYSNGSQNLKTGYKKYKPLSVFLQPNAGGDFTGVHRYLKSASNLNGNLNCSKELEHYAS